MNKLTEIMGIATISAGLIFAPGCIKKETQEEKTKTTLPQVELKESETIECTVVKIETFDVDYDVMHEKRNYRKYSGNKKMTYLTVKDHEGTKQLIYPWGVGFKQGIANITYRPVKKNIISKCKLVNTTHNLNGICHDNGSTLFTDGIIMLEEGIEYKL